jgi:hypothetical protein
VNATDSEPLVFISHKHSDREIAETVARFVKKSSAGKVRVHLSSSPDFDGPRLGQPLNDQLKRALAAADAVILVFTSDTEDWSYCMWECGVATNPNDPRPTTVVVVQCTTDEPKVFKDQLRVDARNLDSVQGFVKALLTSTDIFARRDAPITGFSAEGSEVKDFAADLHGQLAGVLPSGVGAEQSTPTSPYLRIRLDDQAAKDLQTSYLGRERDQSLEILKSRTEIAESSGAENLFGMVLRPESTLGDVLADWCDDHDGEEPRWFSALAEQIEAALVGKLRPVKWAPYQTTIGQADVPYVAASRRIGTGVEFDVYMVPFAPRPIPVREKMITVDQMYFKDAADEPLDEIRLMSLLKDMSAHNASRLPIFDGGQPRSIVHKATINDFIVQAIESGAEVPELTLQDLLTQRADELEESYAEVSVDATIEEAVDAMAAKPGCQDVYVMRDGAVVGWLPNVMFIQD